MLQTVGGLRRLGWKALRVILYPLSGVVLALVAVLAFPAAALWVRWERWTMRRKLRRLVAHRAVTL